MDRHRYLYRGKRKDNNEWIYGGIFIQEEDDVKEFAVYILTSSLDCVCNAYEVDHETVGMFTTVADKNDKPLYTGDICKGYNILHPDRHVYEVAFDDGVVSLFDEDGVGWHYSHIDNIEVIGNIHDNIELLNTFNYQI